MQNAVLSPDGKSIAVAVNTEESEEMQSGIFVLDVENKDADAKLLYASEKLGYTIPYRAVAAYSTFKWFADNSFVVDENMDLDRILLDE